jgi:outer membrane protein assembly factor BamB
MNRVRAASVVVAVAVTALSARSAYRVTAQSAPVAASSASVAMIAAAGEAAAYWPRWRGPGGQGLAAGTGYPDTWSDKQNVLWRTAVPGRGNSSPIVWKDRVFLTTGYGDGRVSVLAFNRGDGKQLWETAVPDRTREYVHQKNTLASATPTTDGTRVYASFGSKGIVAVDFEGRLLWHASLGTFNNYHGTASSPLLYKDRLIVFQDHEGGSQGGAFVAAIDSATGKTRWRTPRRASVGWSTPIAIRAFDHDEIIVSSQSRVHAYSPDTGAELWTCSGNLFEVIPTPVVGHGMVFCSSGRAGPTLAIKPGGKGDVTQTHLAWQSPRGSPFVPSPLLYGDHLYLVNDMSSIATAFKAATGEVLWQGRLGVARAEGFSASPVGVDGKVFFTNDDGETFVLRAGPTFTLLQVNQLNARVLASPALVDGRWYFRTDRDLVAIGTSR